MTLKFLRIAILCISSLINVFATPAIASPIEYHFSHPNAFGWISFDIEAAADAQQAALNLSNNFSLLLASDTTELDDGNYLPMSYFDYNIVVSFPANSFLRTYDNSQTDNRNLLSFINYSKSDSNSGFSFLVGDADSLVGATDFQITFTESTGNPFPELTLQEKLDAVDGDWPNSLLPPLAEDFAPIEEIEFALYLNRIELIRDNNLASFSSGATAATAVTPVPIPAPLVMVGTLMIGILGSKKVTGK